MDKITLSDIQTSLIIIVSIITSVGFLLSKARGWLSKDIHEEMKPLTEMVERFEERIDRVDMQQTKNYLVRSLADIERGVKLSETELIRMKEQYDYYTEKGQNSYIKDKYEKLQREGKL